MKLSYGALTIYEVEELKEFFTMLLDEEKIELDFSEVESIDASVIQLLISLKKSADKHNKPFLLTHVHGEVKKAIEITGCDTVLGV